MAPILCRKYDIPSKLSLGSDFATNANTSKPQRMSFRKPKNFGSLSLERGKESGCGFLVILELTSQSGSSSQRPCGRKEMVNLSGQYLGKY